jgi:hypothetical protein
MGYEVVERVEKMVVWMMQLVGMAEVGWADKRTVK